MTQSAAAAAMTVVKASAQPVHAGRMPQSRPWSGLGLGLGLGLGRPQSRPWSGSGLGLGLGLGRPQSRPWLGLGLGLGMPQSRPPPAPCTSQGSSYRRWRWPVEAPPYKSSSCSRRCRGCLHCSRPPTRSTSRTAHIARWGPDSRPFRTRLHNWGSPQSCRTWWSQGRRAPRVLGP